MVSIKLALKFLLTGEISLSRFWGLRGKISSSHGLVRRIYSFIYTRYSLHHNAGIPVETQISECPVFPHGIDGVFISKGAKIGRNCTIFHQVTIGSNTLKGSKHTGTPVIGDNVLIGAGAKIIGGIHVGNNVCIGANCVVSDDIPDRCSVVMPKPRVIHHKSEREIRFISWDEYVKGGDSHDKEESPSMD